MASRLDRLFVLLETGSTPSTRKAASQQLGQVQRLHPHELPYLLQRTHKCLRSTSWETRIAAGQAVEAILSQIPSWPECQFPGIIKKEEEIDEEESTSNSNKDEDVKPTISTATTVASGSSSSSSNNNNNSNTTTKKEQLTFNNFDIKKLLIDSSSYLMASEAKVFDKEEQVDQAKQRDMINQRLGLDIAAKMGIDTSDIVSQEDLGNVEQEKLQQPPQKEQNMVIDEDPFIPDSLEKDGKQSTKKNRNITTTTTTNNEDKTQQQQQPQKMKRKISYDRSFSSNSVFDDDEPLSSREINLAKRRARKLKSREVLESQSSVDESGKKLKREDSIDYSSCSSSLGDFTAHFTSLFEEGQWPLSGWVDMLIYDLFHPQWEVRHGAATGLREVIRLHGSSGGRLIPNNSTSQESHDKWLEDLALRLVSVLALDRFGDFVSDQVVAPVRETCSQCLGTIITLMTSSSVKSLLNILIKLLEQKAWEVRHGALLGLKYVFAVRRDLMTDFLPFGFPSVFQCLSDSVDDVCAVAASALIPISDILVSRLPKEAPLVVNVLWDSLADLDDLSSACNSIMGLLAKLLAFPTARSTLRGLDALMPRLWPFLHHTSSSVRKSALMTLQKLSDTTVTPLSPSPLQETLRHTYQRALLEHIPEVLHLIPEVWTDLLKSSRLDILLLAACPVFGSWLCLAMQPPRVPIDPALLVGPKSLEDRKKSHPIGEGTTKLYMSGSGDGDPLRIAETRLILTKMLGELVPYIVSPFPSGTIGESPMDCFVRIISVYLNSRSALQRTVASLVLSSWPNPEESIKAYSSSTSTHNGNSVNNKAQQKLNLKEMIPSYNILANKLLECLNQILYFDEIAVGFSRLQNDSKDFISTLKYYKVPLPKELDISTNTLFTFDQVQLLCSESIQNVITQHVKKSKVLDTLLDRRKSIFNIWSHTTTEYASLNTVMLSSLAGAVVNLNCLPEKLNPVVKPLMESLRKEENELFQRVSARHLCRLMGLVLDRNPCPIPKIIQNLTAFLCADGDFTPASIEETDGILSLIQLNSNPENSGVNASSKKMTKVEEIADFEAKKILRIQRRGATLALTNIVQFFGTEVPTKVSRLWELTFGALEAPEDNEPESLRKVIDALQILEIISPRFHKDLFQKVEEQIGRTCALLGHKVRAVRHMASRCLSVWASIMPDKVLPTVAKSVIPMLDVGDNHIIRQGAIEAIWCIVDRLGLNVLPMIVLLVVPVLGRMSDQEESVRSLASLTFATLVRLMPLEGCVPDPPDLPDDLAIKKGEQRKFLEQLLNPKCIPEYKITVPINAELRPYQQAGINWLGFLNTYKLHAILCDDMGLGKTLQSICILGSDHYNRMEKYKLDKSPDSSPLPSIVICPPTLTGHWVYEIEKFISREYLNPLHYHGPPCERNKLKPKMSNHNLVVCSYDIVRNDIDFFSSITWNYIILDEGHIIKNGKTKISKAIKELRGLHRLILSGTPIQNNVLELWSLFDFLMPGFLGSEKQFSARFARPILLARDPKSSPKDQEAGALAMEALHRQALPFLLRRLKEDVLKDLPPKITQDYYCDLSPIQEQLYEDFARTRVHQTLKDTFTAHTEDSSKHSHIFQALQYLRKVCNHPKLVLTPQHPKFTSVMGQLSQTKSSLHDIQHSAKLPALKQLLLDCGIGVIESSNSVLDGGEVVGQHRALIFCQLKTMLDILEHDLFKTHMPTVTYLRLDGSVPAGQRHSLVTRFNNDPSIDVLILTTQVGGLGLNLTGADTVIFVEHDWNPMRDLQAMDRAHRIGQKKVVNVYRLITRGTLEEKIMGLQKFKLMTANTVISQENSCMETMATDQILDLFVLEDNKDENRRERKEDLGSIVGAYKNVLDQIPELWDDCDYSDEYENLDNFIKNLNK